MNNDSIITYARDRGIEYCVHFTNVLNLPSILEHGLLPKNILREGLFNFQENDEYRYDGFENATSLSITFPNYKMFYNLRCNNRDINWAIIFLDAYKVFRRDCAFNFTNAANNEVRNIDIRKRKTLSAFKKMFSENHPFYKREEMKIETHETTDPQAEVLVFDVLPTEFISFVVFDSDEVFRQYKPFLDNMKIPGGVDRGYFYPRRDYSFW